MRSADAIRPNLFSPRDFHLAKQSRQHGRYNRIQGTCCGIGKSGARCRRWKGGLSGSVGLVDRGFVGSGSKKGTNRICEKGLFSPFQSLMTGDTLRNLNVVPHITPQLRLKPGYMARAEGATQSGGDTLWSSSHFHRHFKMLADFRTVSATL